MTTGVTAEQPCLPPFTEEQQRDLITTLLRDVSRSFYLTLRVLPSEIRPQISLAYLLARATDTIADTESASRDERIALLREMREGDVGATFLSRLSGMAESRQDCRSYGETALLRRLADCYRALARFDDSDRQRIRELLRTITGGQIFDLERFPGKPLTDEELDRYTYMVAGCVGEFWTKMCQAHLPELEGWKDGRMEEAGVRFGKGLQLVNILRDMPKDLRIGRCYLPVEKPERLLDPENYESIRAEYTKWLDRAVEHLDAGWKYTLAVPASLWRLRLACIWPIWIGLRTIARLRVENPLDPARRVKISRGEVYTVMARSALTCRSDSVLDRTYRSLRAAAKSDARMP